MSVLQGQAWLFALRNTWYIYILIVFNQYKVGITIVQVHNT